MAKIIAVNGKGGTGKTTVAALLIKKLIRDKRGSVLAIDADPNSNLPELLDAKIAATMVGVVEDISKNMDKIPAGITKDRFIEMKIQETITEENGYDLLAMGRPEGPGCYCYVNNLLRDLMGKITKNYDFVVIDNAAGMEHISRRTTRVVDKLLLVSDYSAIGIRSTKRIYDLAKELGIKMGESFLIINKAKDSVNALKDEVEKTGIKVAGLIPYDEALYASSIENKPIFKFESRAVENAIEEISKNLKI